VSIHLPRSQLSNYFESIDIVIITGPFPQIKHFVIFFSKLLEVARGRPLGHNYTPNPAAGRLVGWGN
jgi:hypothetical protein